MGGGLSALGGAGGSARRRPSPDRKSTRLNSSHRCISYAVFCLKKKKKHLQKLLQIQKPCWTYEQFSRSYHWNHPSSLLYPLLKFLTYFIRSCIQAHAQFSFVNA